jgi:hypothetical protein
MRDPTRELRMPGHRAVARQRACNGDRGMRWLHSSRRTVDVRERCAAGRLRVRPAIRRRLLARVSAARSSSASPSNSMITFRPPPVDDPEYPCTDWIRTVSGHDEAPRMDGIGVRRLIEEGPDVTPGSRPCTSLGMPSSTVTSPPRLVWGWLLMLAELLAEPLGHGGYRATEDRYRCVAEHRWRRVRTQRRAARKRRQRRTDCMSRADGRGCAPTAMGS